MEPAGPAQVKWPIEPWPPGPLGVPGPPGGRPAAWDRLPGGVGHFYPDEFVNFVGRMGEGTLNTAITCYGPYERLPQFWERPSTAPFRSSEGAPYPPAGENRAGLVPWGEFLDRTLWYAPPELPGGGRVWTYGDSWEEGPSSILESLTNWSLATPVPGADGKRSRTFVWVQTDKQAAASKLVAELIGSQDWDAVLDDWGSRDGDRWTYGSLTVTRDGSSRIVMSDETAGVGELESSNVPAGIEAMLGESPDPFELYVEALGRVIPDLAPIAEYTAMGTTREHRMTVARRGQGAALPLDLTLSPRGRR